MFVLVCICALAFVFEIAFNLLVSSFQVSLLVRRELTERARDFNIILDDVSITELSFGKEYTAAVEAKQVSYICR